MDKYLLELLQEVNTIIIPGFGALTITNADTGEIMFMPYLKHDDGKFSGYIASKKGIDENEAKNQVAKYVREISSKIDQGDSYDIFQFGSFFKNAEGDIDFKKWDGQTATTSVDLKEEKVEKEKTEETVIPEVELTKEEAKPEKKEEEKKVPAVPVEEKKDEVKATAEVPKEKEKTEKVEQEKKAVAKPEKKSVEAKPKKVREKKTDSEGKKKRSPAFWMLMVVIVIICAGGTYVAIDYENVKQHIPFLADKEKKDKKEKRPIDEMKKIMGVDSEESESEAETENSDNEEVSTSDDAETETEVMTEENVTTPEPELKTPKESKVVNAPSNGSYHVIAGAFSSSENAERLAANLKAQGYPVIIGSSNGLNLVSIKSFSTKQEAENSLAELKGVAPKAWVYSGNL